MSLCCEEISSFSPLEIAHAIYTVIKVDEIREKKVLKLANDLYDEISPEDVVV